MEQVPAAGTASAQGSGRGAWGLPGLQERLLWSSRLGRAANASRTVPGDVLTQFLSSSPDSVKLFQLGRSHPAL